MVERKDKEPVFGRLDDLDDVSSLAPGLHRSGPAPETTAKSAESRPPEDTPPSLRGSAADEPGPPISVVGSLTTRAQADRSDGIAAATAKASDPGTAMRIARETCGLGQADLASRTLLPLRIIEDLECNRFDAMPPAYVRGYMRAVARELDRDAEAKVWISAYEEMGFAEPVLKATVHPNASARWGLGGVWGLLVGAILVTALGLGVYAWTEVDGSDPFEGLAGWFSDTVQRFSPTRPADVPAVPDVADATDAQEVSDVEASVLSELWQELQWVTGSEPTAPPPESDGVESGGLEAVSALPEPALPSAQTPTPAPESAETVGETEPATPFEPETATAEPQVTEPRAAVSPPAPADSAATEDAGTTARAANDAAPPPEAAAPVPVSPAETAEAPVPAASAVSSTAEPTVPSGSTALTLAFEGTSWIEIRSASDRVALQGIFHAGDERSVVVEMPARVILGNAPAVRLNRDGRPVALQAHTRDDRTARLSLAAD